MNTIRGKSTFTIDEYNKLKPLIESLKKSPADKQKGIRAKIRRIGLYWQDVANNADYTIDNFHKLIKDGTIKIEGLPSGAITITSAKPQA